MDSTRHVIDRIVNPRMLGQMTTYDVTSTDTRSARPRFLIYMPSYQVASTILVY